MTNDGIGAVEMLIEIAEVDCVAAGLLLGIRDAETSGDEARGKRLRDVLDRRHLLFEEGCALWSPVDVTIASRSKKLRRDMVKISDWAPDAVHLARVPAGRYPS